MRSWRTASEGSAFKLQTPIRTHTHPGEGMTLARRAWVRLNRLRTGVGHFRSSLYKWGMASSAICECCAEEQRVDHVILQCPTHRPPSPPRGLHGLTVLDDEAIEWLLKTCPKSSVTKQRIKEELAQKKEAGKAPGIMLL